MRPWLFGRKNVVRKASDGGGRSENGALDVSDIRSLGFWISNALTIVATILGVYLAASEGFKQAMEFRQVEESEHTYELLTALRSELELNHSRVQAVVVKGLETLPPSHAEPPQPQRYIWRTMQNVPETFRVPTSALNGIALYYAQLDAQLPIAFDKRKHPSDQRAAFVKLKSAGEQFDQDVMLVIDQKMATLRQQLIEYGVNPDL